MQSVVMDPTTSDELCASTNGFNLSDETLSALFDSDLADGLKYGGTVLDRNYANIPPLPTDLLPSCHVNGSFFQPSQIPSHSALSSNLHSLGCSHEDFDFSDVVLKYINQMLVEEDIEEKTCMFQESAALQAAELSLYELIREKCTSPASSSLSSSRDQFHENPNESKPGYSNYSVVSNSKLVDLGLICDLEELQSPVVASQANSQSSYGSPCGSGNTGDGFVDSPVSILRVPEILSDNESVMQFKRGFEEASKFIPNGNFQSINWENDALLKEMKNVVVSIEKKHDPESAFDVVRRKKNSLPSDVDLDKGRSNKHSSVYTEAPVRSEMFDMVLLNCGQNDSVAKLRKALQSGTGKNSLKSSQPKGGNAGKTSRGKKKVGKTDVVDLRALLTLCAQSVAANDQRSANELLKQIRQHASPTGDGMQRVAHYFANGLEARLAGSGQIHTALISKPTSAADILKAYHLFLAACPFRKLSNFFANKTIMNLAEKAPRLHIIDFGILYGFQWPCLIQRLSSRLGGPPKLKITGIDFPIPGFRPASRVEETGSRLSNYAESFNVPFEFNAIAQKWDTIQIEDLKLDGDEILVVNCLYRFRNILDETVVVESPRDVVLNLIKKMKPDVFVQGVVNGAYSSPFFITRFREALFHFSTLFDMLETNVPREVPERKLIEQEIFGWECMNAIACEGAERIERPETFKQWQVRNLRAGFEQLPLNREIIETARDRVANYYHKDFVIDEDSQWLLQGWKGRIIYALSSWRSAS